MKLVFVASIAGKEKLDESYEMISNICKKKGHNVFDD